MQSTDIHIRVAKTEDMGKLLGIYAPYVEKTAITFDYEVPSLEEYTDNFYTSDLFPQLHFHPDSSKAQ